MRARIVGVAAAVVVLIAAAVVFGLQSRDRGPAVNSVAVVTGQPVSVQAKGQLLFRNTAEGPDFGHLATVPADRPGEPRKVAGLSCDRFATSAGTALCLAAQPGVLPPMTDVIVLDQDLKEIRRVELPGTPSRGRVSPDGKLVYWTLFVNGDSYAENGFSTRAGILDLSTGNLMKSIEEMGLLLDGKPYYASDVNYWGITFAPDGKRFYATVGTKGKTYLVEADYERLVARMVRENVECPSLSPDGKRIAFKKRVSTDSAAPWRLAVLELASGRETLLAETRSVDDQAAWLDDRTVAYGLESGIWTVPADGTGSAKLLVQGASSPAGV
ncbi:TolB family protein [Amycolatopsis orientalis]|uniref:TolB family protein n=1 Tax=Amycolatopsis orientalis TaxID=31958 RepID=UPI0004284BC2|nr:PD40 domain-containing protein [Amycolatopsis orientalis]